MGEELEVAPQKPDEPFLDITIDTQPPIVENAPKVIFKESLESHILLEDIQQEQCDDKFIIEYSIHERELLGNQVVSLGHGNLVISEEVYINDKFVEIISCSKLLIAKLVQYVQEAIFPHVVLIELKLRQILS